MIIYITSTRMHSSRMRTGRSLTVCCSLLPGGVCLVRGGLPGPGGVSTWSGGVLPAQRGVCLVPGGYLLGPGGSAWSRGDVCLVRGVLPAQGGSAWSRGRVSAWSRGVLPAGGGSAWSRGGSPETPPLVNRITDTCKNITLATTSLRPVTRHCVALLI